LGLISYFKGRGFISRTQAFNYEPDKPAEYLVGEFNIDEGFDAGDVGFVTHL
jgi:hypothetical protein